MGQKAGDRLSSSMGGQTRRIFVLHQKQRLAAGMGREMGDLIAFFAALRTHVDMVTSSLVMDYFFFSFLFFSFLFFFFFFLLDVFSFQFFASLDFMSGRRRRLTLVAFGQDCYWQE